MQRRLARSLINRRAPAELASLGDRLRRARLDRGLTMVELADRLGVSESSIRAWERGYYRPGKDALERVRCFCQHGEHVGTTVPVG